MLTFPKSLCKTFSRGLSSSVIKPIRPFVRFGEKEAIWWEDIAFCKLNHSLLDHSYIHQLKIEHKEGKEIKKGFKKDDPFLKVVSADVERFNLNRDIKDLDKTFSTVGLGWRPHIVNVANKTTNLKKVPSEDIFIFSSPEEENQWRVRVVERWTTTENNGLLAMMLTQSIWPFILSNDIVQHHKRSIEWSGEMKDVKLFYEILKEIQKRY